MMFEHKSESVLPQPLFFKRLVIFSSVAIGVVLVALGLGIMGYHYICDLSWLDSLLNASMILTGMGPVNTMNSSSAKVFASIYALFSGVVFLSSTGIILSPVLHRIMHILHMEDSDSSR